MAAVFTAVGDKAFCTGGNTKEYAEYYTGRPEEYGAYMDLFNGMVDAILACKKPTICRVNGMRVAGGQEIGMACDLAVSADTAIFGQAGPRHGSAPDGGSTDFLPWYLSIEDSMWNCVSCELWSAYKMKRLGLISKVAPAIKEKGKFIRKGGKTRYNGIRWDKNREKWQVRLTINGRRESFGYYADETEAAKAYDRVAREHRGEYACLNFPKE